MESRYDLLLEKLSRFTRKYYRNQLLRGCLLSTCILLSYYLGVSYTEYLAYFPTLVRTILFVFGLLIFLWVVVFLILIPFFKLNRFGRQLSNLEAANIINKHFPELEDRLLNTIELAEKMELDKESSDLVVASINQRIESIRIIPFRNAISYKENLRFLKYLVPMVIIGLIVFFYNPGVYSNSGKRLMNFRQEFEPPAAFHFHLMNDSLEVEKGGDFALKLALEGDYIPNEVFCCLGGNQFRMKREKSNQFFYLLRNVNNPVPFFFTADNLRSQDHLLKIISSPLVVDFTVNVQPPAYTGIKPSFEKNIGDLTIPQGTVIRWSFQTQDTDSLKLVLKHKKEAIGATKTNDRFICEEKILSSTEYSVLVSNNRFQNRELINYRLNVIPDQFPKIQVASIVDSLSPSVFYYKGVIQDDYGFSKLQFKYHVDNGEEMSVSIPMNKNLRGHEFYFAFDFSKPEVEEGETIHYFFEVKDNDGINGPKAARTTSQRFAKPSSKQLFDLNEQIQDSLTNRLEESMELSRSIQKDILRLQQSFIQNPGDEWQKQQLFKEIQGKRDRLENLLKQIQEENSQKNQFMNSFGKQDSLLMEKQKQIEDLLSKVMDEELQKLMEEFQKLSQDFDPEKLNKLGEKLQLSFDDMEKQLDRNLELLKRFEMEGQFKKIADRLEALSKSQEELSESVKDKSEETKPELQRDSASFQEIRKDYKKMLERNEELKAPFSMEDFDVEFEDISRMMQDAGKFMMENKGRKASDNLQKSSGKLRDLSNKMNSALANSMQAQLTVDVDNLMRLLNNLMEFSFEQEELIYDLRAVDYHDPRFQEINQEQMLQNEKYKQLKDSLIQLSGRSPQIAAAMSDHIFNIDRKLDEVLKQLEERQKHRILVTQQEIMKETNDLAVFLSEALRNLREQMANAMPGNQMGESKGQPVPSLSGLRNQQQSIKEQLKQMIQEMKEGKEKGAEMNQKLARMLRQQEMYRNSIQELQKKGGVGRETDQILKDVMKMIERTENEIANFSINSNTLVRQNQILTRLLEAENTERQKDWDRKRESRKGNNYKLSNPKEIFEYKRVQTNFNDNFFDSNVKLLDYYNKLYLEYIIRLSND